MTTRYCRENTDKLVQEIKKKETLAENARKNGMHATYGNYKADIAYLQYQLKKLRTAPWSVER